MVITLYKLPCLQEHVHECAETNSLLLAKNDETPNMISVPLFSVCVCVFLFVSSLNFGLILFFIYSPHSTSEGMKREKESARAHATTTQEQNP